MGLPSKVFIGYKVPLNYTKTILQGFYGSYKGLH
jgi:hypothetical protein